MSLWTSEMAQSATGGDSRHQWSAEGISIDSRTLNKGDLFVALTDQRDGHQFVSAAFEAGAVAAIVSKIPENVPENAPVLVVPNVLKALSDLAVWRRRETTANVVAVTGSVGKTSTKEMLRVILSNQGRTHAAKKSYNNHWGVPLTLASMPVNTQYAVIEIGMNSAGEIAPLSQMARPDIGIITEIAPAHLASFNALEEIAEEKGSLFTGLKKGGFAILHSGSPCIDVLERSAKFAGATIKRFGGSQKDHLRLIETRSVSSGMVLKIGAKSKHYCVMLHASGRHFARNALGALLVAETAGANLDIAALDLRQWEPPPGRGNILEIRIHPERPPLFLIDDAFNANPSSLEAALEALENRRTTSIEPNGKTIVFLGDMLELGPSEVQMHESIADLPSLKNVSQIHCAGPLMQRLHQKLDANKRGQWRKSSKELASIVRESIAPGDLVLVKGSKGSQISIVADTIRRMSVAEE